MKYSAGVTFNENTDLIIEADPTGEVTSCRNIINGVEYVGGGGESDLSIAEVTFINSQEGSYPYIVIICNCSDEEGTITGRYNVAYNEPLVLKVPLYKNKFALPIQSITDVGSALPSATGGVNINFENSTLDITGNGTFTASGQIPA